MTILRDCYEGLVSMAPDGTPVAGAAESWTVSADGRRYAFKLRATARWSNGDRVVAQDFVAAWRRLVDPATASQYALMLEPVANAADIVAGRKPADSLGVAAPDEATLVVDLAEPSPYFLAMLSHPSTFPVHRPTLAAKPKEFARPGIAVTNGAFTPAEWAIGSHIRATRNAHYWNDAATKLDAVRYVHVADPTTELTRFRAGDLDVTYTVPPGEVARLERALPGQLRIAPTVGVYYYGFALDLPPFKDAPRLRRALAMAVDREVLAKQVLGDGERPAHGWVPPGVAGYAPQQFDWATLDAAKRIAEAKRLYAEAGYSAAKPLEVELRTSKSPLHDRIALAVIAMWQEHLGAEGQPALRGLPRAEGGDRRARGAALPRQLDRRLQRRLLIPPGDERRIRHQPAALRERHLRRRARHGRGITRRRTRDLPRGGRAPTARRRSADPALFLRVETSGGAEGRRAGTTTS